MVSKSQSSIPLPSWYFRLMFCGHATALLSRKVVAVVDLNRLVAYADESEETEGPRSPFLIAAYVMPASIWMTFADDWHDCCVNQEPRVPYFHAIDAEGRKGPFKGMPREFCNAKIRDLASIIRKYRVMNLQCWVDRDDYDQVFRGKVKPEIDDPYFLLFFQLIALMAIGCIRHGVLEPVDFIFDERKHMEQRVLNAYFEVQKRASPLMLRLLGNTPRFESDERVPPLQAADMLAWHRRRAIAYPDEQRPIVDILSLLQPEFIGELEINRELLQSFVEQWNEPNSPFAARRP